MIDREMVSWLAKKLAHEKSAISGESIDLIWDNKDVLFFLCIWSVFEPAFSKKCYLKFQNLEALSKKYSHLSDLDDISNLSRYFHARYHGHNERLLKLAHLDEYERISPEVRNIVEERYDILNGQQKMLLLLYVVYRYRNNIFHGNKSITQWECFGEQINYCIQFMIKMIDNKKPIG